ncbi:hypothetical protein [Bdellovibrio sp. HCB209]|uniref:hypothetical protein n=1 Tax=Bdellovibrio sp. HCB209 TaxID=3394354 RepID=UPI0039B52611
MNNMKSVFSVVIVALAVIGCNSSSGGGGGGVPDNSVYPQGEPITGYGQVGGPQQQPGVQLNQGIESGTYAATILCDNGSGQVTDGITFTFSNGTYLQDIVSGDYRCRQNCAMTAEGTYSLTGDSVVLNQTRLLNEYGGMIQGPRTNTLYREHSVMPDAVVDSSAPVVVLEDPEVTMKPEIQKKKGKVKPRQVEIVLKDNGTQNVCNGPFRMILKKK